MLEDLAFQEHMLPKVSRTFALTVPQLPSPLDDIVGNAYLLCRIADALEDDPGIEPDQRGRLYEMLPDVVEDAWTAEHFSREAAGALSAATPPEERDLVANTARVARTTRSLQHSDRAAITACLREMCNGMEQYRRRTDRGVHDLADLERYCHYVAGVVGAMLTELFCNHGEGVAAARARMQPYAESFGLGLQMTNILKDVWDDLQEQRCWLPRAEFAQVGYDLEALAPDYRRPLFNRAITPLVAVAHGHLRNALAYTLCIPAAEMGIRRFCLWSIGLALLTLKRIHSTPDYSSGREVKISRATVSAVMASTAVVGRINAGARILFDLWSRGLPLETVTPRDLNARIGIGGAEP